MTQFEAAEELRDARRRARNLIERGYSREDAAKQMANEFHICVYATATGLFASYVEREREVKTRLA